jgi:hypothetical protein
MKLQLLILAAFIGIAQVAPIASCSMPNCRCGTHRTPEPVENSSSCAECCGDSEIPETGTPSDHPECDGSCLSRTPTKDAERPIQVAYTPEFLTSPSPVLNFPKDCEPDPIAPHGFPHPSRASPTGRLLHLVFLTLLI